MPAFHVIRTRFGGDDEGPWFVIHSDNCIHAVCLRLDLNPMAKQNPAQVWVGDEKHVAAWGKRLAFHTKTVPLFVSNGDGQDYEDRGIYRVTDTTISPVVLDHAEKTFGVGRLSRIVYLTPAEDTPITWVSG